MGNSSLEGSSLQVGRSTLGSSGNPQLPQRQLWELELILQPAPDHLRPQMSGCKVFQF